MKYNTYIGYYYHPDHHFQRSATIFSKGNEKITVGMLIDALDKTLEILAEKDQTAKDIKTAIDVCKVLRVMMNNQRTHKPSKEDFKTTFDAIAKIENDSLPTKEAKEQHKRECEFCKVLIDFFYKEEPNS